MAIDNNVLWSENVLLFHHTTLMGHVKPYYDVLYCVAVFGNSGAAKVVYSLDVYFFKHMKTL